MKRYLPLIIAVAAIATLGSGAMLYRAKLARPLTISEDKSVSREGDAESMHIRGNPEASVTLEEFGDFECPSCANLATFLDQLIKEYHPRVRLIFRNFPLPMQELEEVCGRKTRGGLATRLLRSSPARPSRSGREDELHPDESRPQRLV